MAIFEFQAANRRAQNHFPAPALDFRFAAVIQIRKGNRWHTHAVTGAAREKRFPEDIDTEMCVAAIELLVESTDQNDAPETVDGAFGLAAAAKPLEHRDSARFVKLQGITRVLNDVEHGAGDREFVTER